MGQSQGPKIVNGVVIPPLLDLHTDTDARAFPTYWILERYYVGPWPPDTLTSQIEPIRAKVEATQDLTGLSATDDQIVNSLNRLYNTDFDSSTYVGTTFVEFGLLA